MRVLVLGANGFIGRNLVKALSEVNDVIVTGYGRTGNPKLNGNIRFVTGDLEDQSALSDVLRNQDIVYHLISHTIPSSSWTNPVLDIEKNLIPTVRLIELGAAAGVKKICFASSGGTVYGLQDSLLTENSITDPFSPYGIVKRSIESFLQYGKLNFGVNYNIYRISNVYGEGQNIGKGLGFINTVLDNIINNRPVIVYGNGENVRDFIHVNDVAYLLSLGVKNDFDSCDIFNVSANQPISLNGLLDLIKRVLEIDFQVEYRPNRLNDNKTVEMDNSKILASSGNFPLISLEDGVRNTYNFLKRRDYAEKSI